VLIVLGLILVVFSRLTYKLLDATAGKTAEDVARGGFDASWRMYHWQRPWLRILFPLFLLGLGAGFLVSGLR
jgi:hypothetical protein